MSQRSHRLSRASVKRSSFRPTLEILEDRCLPSGRNFFVDAGRGSDNNPGTQDQPWKTYDNIVSYFNGEPAPANWVALQPGDTVYFASGVYDTYHRYGDHLDGHEAFYLRGVHGTAEQPITIAALPGEKPVFSAHLPSTLPPEQRLMHAMFILQSSHVIIDGIEITGTFGGGIRLAEGEQLEVRHVYVHDTDCIDNTSQHEGLNAGGIDGLIIRDSVFRDNYDRANVAAGKNKEIGLYTGGNYRILNNHIYHTRGGPADGLGAGVMYKHAASIPGSIFEVSGNIFENLGIPIGSGTSGSRIHDNLVLNSGPINVRDFGGITHNEDNVIEFNTLIGHGGLSYDPTLTWGPIGSLTFRNNLIIDDQAHYHQENGIVSIEPYGSDDLFDATAGKLFFFDNLYWNPTQPLLFNLFGANGGRYGIKGDNYSFDGWQGLGLDAGSLAADPRLDNDYLPHLAGAQDKGRRVTLQPAATLEGAVFNDLNGNGLRDTGESGLSGRIVFLDANNNGRRDPQEPTAMTGDTGSFLFTDLVPGEYVLRTELPPNWQLTEPGTGNFNVNLQSGDALRRDFGTTYQPPVTRPKLSVNDISIREGNRGWRILTFTVSLSEVAAATVQVNFATASRTARAYRHFWPVGGILTFAVGEQTKTINVPIRSNRLPEANKYFLLRLGNPINADLGKRLGRATILNDD